MNKQVIIPAGIQNFINKIKEEGFLPVFNYERNVTLTDNEKSEYNKLNIVLGVSKDLKKVATYKVQRDVYDNLYEYYSDAVAFAFNKDDYGMQIPFIASAIDEDDEDGEESYWGSLAGIDFSPLRSDDPQTIEEVSKITWEEQAELISEAVALKWRSKEFVARDIVRSLYRIIEGLSYDDGVNIIKTYMKSASVKQVGKYLKIEQTDETRNDITTAFKISDGKNNIEIYFEDGRWKIKKYGSEIDE